MGPVSIARPLFLQQITFQIFAKFHQLFLVNNHLDPQLLPTLRDTHWNQMRGCAYRSQPTLCSDLTYLSIKAQMCYWHLPPQLGSLQFQIFRPFAVSRHCDAQKQPTNYRTPVLFSCPSSLGPFPWRMDAEAVLARTDAHLASCWEVPAKNFWTQGSYSLGI